VRTAFVAANALIALDYLLIGIFFLSRLHMTRSLRRANPYAVAALLAMGLFFFGCVHTHVELAWHVWHGEAHHHWHTWQGLASHILQGVGGFVFWVLAQRHLIVNIFDRASFWRANDGGLETERRLEIMAIRVGLQQR
jgi:ABC-type long-subunit fatty acid transport system fused permease/ATPase subunit